ncbi:hypothetical protein FACS189428_1450 [Clostridia bacterium]|nr:hypothetical protein FACS189428_1450 [Clostridia bacterium]
MHHRNENSKILYLEQSGTLHYKDEEDSEEIELAVHVDLNKQKNYLSPSLYARIQ